jgi:hypothetical protein
MLFSCTLLNFRIPKYAMELDVKIREKCTTIIFSEGLQATGEIIQKLSHTQINLIFLYF